MTWIRRSAALIVALGLTAACGGDDGSSTDSSASSSNASTTVSSSPDESTAEPTTETTTEPTTEDGGTPQSGGSLTYAVAAESVGLDPVVSNLPGAGTGGNELVALYDTLIRFNPESGEFEPRLAESLTPNADLTVWTLKLRPGVTFSDGTPLDADAVTFHLKRLVDQKSRSATLLAPIDHYEAVDPLTVELTMKEPWRATPSIFSGAPGMIVSPTAVAALGDGLPTNPVGAGAGPFLFESFKPGESIVLTRNPDYWGGPAYLDQLKFVPIASPPQAVQALEGGSVQAAFFRDFVAIDAVEASGFSTIKATASSGNTLIMNNGVKVECSGGQPAPICDGAADGTTKATESPTSDQRLRQAVASAIDLDVLNQRVWEGKGIVGSELIGVDSKWYDGVAGPEYDPDLAKQLVEEVKAEGAWDGSIRLECHSGLPAFGQAVKAQLEAAGFSVEVNDQQDIRR